MSCSSLSYRPPSTYFSGSQKLPGKAQVQTQSITSSSSSQVSSSPVSHSTHNHGKMSLTCVCKPTKQSILEMYNCSPHGHKFLGNFYCWRHLFNRIASMRKCGQPGCAATNHFHTRGRSDAVGQWFCDDHQHSLYSRYNCDVLIILWVLKQQEYPPDIVRNIYQLVVRGLDPAQLEATAKALHRRHQRELHTAAVVSKISSSSNSSSSSSDISSSSPHHD